MKFIISGSYKDYINNYLNDNKLDFVDISEMSLTQLNSVLTIKGLSNNNKLFGYFFNKKINEKIINIFKQTKFNLVIIAENNKIPESLKVFEIVKTDENVYPPIEIMDKLGLSNNINYEKVPIGTIIKHLNVNWDKFESKEEIFKILKIVNRRMYKVSDDYLYLFLMWGFPKQVAHKTFYRKPNYLKETVSTIIIKKIAKYYNYSTQDVKNMWWLIKRVIDYKTLKKYGVTDDEALSLGFTPIKIIPPKPQKEEIKYNKLI